MEPREHGDPRFLGNYRILARIGSGGMAVVYLGRSRGGRAVAVKVMHADLAGRPELRERFRRELTATEAAGGVHSPPVLGADPGADVPWMATEFLPSVSLREAVERFGPLPAFSVWRLAAGLAEALVAIHGVGIVHLDVKPANVLLTADGPKLIDFGIVAGASPAEPAGTEGFMSPEQVDGANVGPASDVYSLGSTLAYACGRTQDDTAADEALRAVIADCRRHEPAARPTAAALTERLAPQLTQDEQRPDVAWLPPRVMAAIAARANEADSPPPEPPDPAYRRRRLLLAGAIIAVAGGGAGAVLALIGDNEGERATGKAPGQDATARRPGNDASSSSSPPSSPTPTRSPEPAPEPEPELEPVVVEFVIRGDGPIETLTYAVNREPTTLENVTLPWSKTVRTPREVGNVAYGLDLSHYGEITYRVTVDDREVWSDSSPNPSIPADLLGDGPYNISGGGEIAFAVPSPGTSA